MFSNEEILKMLREGTSPDDVAKAMSDALNSANKTFEAEKKAKEAAEKKLAEEKAQKEARNAEKIEYLNGILDDFADWYAEYYAGSSEAVTAEDIIDLIDSSKELASTFYSLLDVFDGKCRKTFKNDNGKLSKTVMTEDTVDSFLKELGL